MSAKATQAHADTRFGPARPLSRSQGDQQTKAAVGPIMLNGFANER